MKSAPYSKEEAEELVTKINRLTGMPLYKGMDLTIERAFVFPYKAHQSLIDLFQNFSEMGRPLGDILADRNEQYSLFDVALVYKEADDEGIMCQSVGMFSQQLTGRV